MCILAGLPRSTPIITHSSSLPKGGVELLDRVGRRGHEDRSELEPTLENAKK